MKKKVVNKFESELIRLEKEKERLIMELLILQWSKDRMNYLSFDEWVMR